MISTSESRIKQRSVIEFLTLEGCAPIEIHTRMKAIYGDCMDVKNVRKWARRAKGCAEGEMSVFDEQRQGRPITVTNEENERKVEAMLQENRKVKQREIAMEVGISQERVQHIIETLNYKKMCAKMASKRAKKGPSKEATENKKKKEETGEEDSAKTVVEESNKCLNQEA